MVANGAEEEGGYGGMILVENKKKWKLDKNCEEKRRGESRGRRKINEGKEEEKHQI